MRSRVHRVLRRLLLPSPFRERFGAEMEAVFSEALAGAPDVAAQSRLWLREARDLWMTGRQLRQARRRHGAGFVARRTTTTGGGMMTGLVDDIRYAWRSLGRQPGFTAFAVLTVALGVGATTAIYSTLEGVVLRPVPYENAERMASLFQPIGNSGALLSADPEQVEAWSALGDVFETIEPMATRSMTLLGSGEPVALQAGLVRHTFHEFAGRWPVVGRPLIADDVRDDARVVLLGHGLWKRRFGGDRDVIGRTLRLDDEPWTVVGVMPPNTPLLTFGVLEVDLWRPLAREAEDRATPVGLLREGVSLEQANERLAVPVPLSSGREVAGEARLVAEMVASRLSDSLRVLMAAVVALLVIACANVSNLLLGRAGQRRHETAVRAALGGGRGRLARQLIVEGFMLGMMGGAAGLALAWVGLGTMLSLRPPALNALDGVSLNGAVLVFTLVVTTGSSLIFSLVPAFWGTRADAVESLRSGTRGGGDGVTGGRVRWTLVSAEVGLSFALVVAASVVLTAFADLRRTDPGFEADRVVSFEVTPPAWRFEDPGSAAPLHQDVQARLAALPAVAQVSLASGRPADAGVFFGQIEVEGGETGGDTEELHGPAVGSGYFAALGQPVLHGRPFTGDEIRSRANVAILGASTASQFFGTEDADGLRFRFTDNGEWWTVVGVVGDVPMRGLSADRPLQLYTPLHDDFGGSQRTYLVRPAPGVAPATLYAELRAAVRERFPDARIEEMATLHQHLSGTLVRERFISTLLSLFTALALTLAGIGLYGVVSQLVGQRTREIGIRMALGADRGRVRGLILRHGLTATLVGCAVGLGLALMGQGLLARVVFGVEAGSLSGYLVALAVVTMVTLLATWVPARRATRVDPVTAMRVE